MPSLRHSLTGHLYERLDGGLVRVDDPATGLFGIFAADGEHRSGELMSADLHMLGWVGGPHSGSEADCTAVAPSPT